MDKEIIGLIAGFVLFYAYGRYLYSMWRGTTRASRSSWWILTVVWGTILLSSASSYVPETGDLVAMTSRWLAVASILGSLSVAISSIWRGSGEKWTKADSKSAIFAGVALVAYFVFHNPEISFFFAIVADFCGLFPTIQHAKDNPEEEDIQAWIVTVIGCLLGVIAIPDWGLSFQSASNWAIPVYLVIVDSIVVYFLVKRFFVRKKA